MGANDMTDELSELSVPNNSSSSNLRNENQKLSRQLKAFVTKVRQNEEKLKRFQTLEIGLISCTSLYELLQTVIYEYRSTSKLDRATLLLYDPEYELRRILEEDQINIDDHLDLLFTEDRSVIEDQFMLSPRAIIGPYQVHRHEKMFHPKIKAPCSIALLPMLRNGELIGSLNLGSYKVERFIPGIATDFLERFATIVSICLNNVKSHEQLKRVGLTDVLTGVNNRRFFDQRLVEETAVVQRYQSPLVCLFFDVDHFKGVNDTYGHQAGDSILKELAGIIRSNLRSNDILARYGGEEFSALLINTSAEVGFEIAERIRAAIESTHFHTTIDNHVRVTISIGMACLTQADIGTAPSLLGSSLVQRADDNLYVAKRTGRNQVVCKELNGECIA